MRSVSTLAKSLQTLFGPVADRLAEKTKVIRRKRCVTGSSLVTGLVFGWLADPRASFEELAESVTGCGTPISRQAMESRLKDPKLSDLMMRLIEEAAGMALMEESKMSGLLGRFTGLHVQDSSVISLPPAYAYLWTGAGGSRGQTRAAMKMEVRLDLKTGQLVGPLFEPSVVPETKSAIQQKPLPPGSLSIGDLGFFDLSQFARLNEQQVYFVSRIQAHTAVFDKHGERLNLFSLLKKSEGILDRTVLVGSKEKLRCRLIAIPVPDEVVRKRRKRLRRDQKRRGRKVSMRAWQWCRWTVVITNAPESLLSKEEALIVLKARWQIELLFKLWKSYGEIDESVSENPDRIMSEMYAKILGQIVQHWVILVTAWENPDRSLTKVARTIRKHATAIQDSFDSTRHFHRVIQKIQRIVKKHGRIPKRTTRPPTYSMLVNTSDYLYLLAT